MGYLKKTFQTVVESFKNKIKLKLHNAHHYRQQKMEDD